MRPAIATPVRVWIVGFGTVGRWLARALSRNAALFEQRYEVRFEVVGLANRRDGFIYRDHGIDLDAALALANAGRPLGELAGAKQWRTALEGIRATDADVLVETSASPPPEGEPGRSHLTEALGRGIAAVTSNKWPVALHAVELARLARFRSMPFRAESTVMSGTPVLSTLDRGAAGTSPVALRGVLNATSNFVLTEVAGGRSYAEALAAAQDQGLAERDPSADVDGHDAVAKLMILAGVVFGVQLRLEDVARRGISSVSEEEVLEAAAAGMRIRELAILERSPVGSLAARVEPIALGADDALAGVSGTDNAVSCRLEPIGEVTIIGPGAGVELAGQGVLSDLLDVARARAI